MNTSESKPEGQSPNKCAVVYMIPTILADDGYQAIPAQVAECVKKCDVFFTENLRTTRRYLKKLMPDIVIDDHHWQEIQKGDADMRKAFAEALRTRQTIGILSEAGCPGVADPGQELVAMAQGAGALVKPLTGPNSILLALMASGMNGQLFRFNGYLPLDPERRIKTLKQLEADSERTGCTHIFIETPYRNDAMLESIVQTCKPETRLCVAVSITSAAEDIRTMTVARWKKSKPELHKIPVIFLLSA